MSQITRNDIWNELEKAEQEDALRPEEFTIQMYMQEHPNPQHLTSERRRKKMYDLLEEMRLDGKLVKRFAAIHGKWTAVYRPQGTKEFTDEESTSS
jgi:hypothetical protein